MTRKIRTPAELDALPQGVVLTSKGVSVAVKLADGLWGAAGFAGAIDSETVARCAHGYLSIVGNISAPAPAPSVVPEAAVERAARAMQAENAPKPDPLNRDQREERDDATIATYRTLASAGLTAALPLLTAAPSATREAVEAVIFEADDECVLEVHEVRSLASRLLARFTITPKEDR